MPRIDHVAVESADPGATGVFFQDPEGRTLEAIVYRGGVDPRRP